MWKTGISAVFGLLSRGVITGSNPGRGKIATFHRRNATEGTPALDNEKPFALLARRAVC